MAYTDQYTLSNDTTFRQRVRIAMLTQAIAIQAEATSTANDSFRSKYAAAVLNAPDTYVPYFAQAVVTQNDPATAAAMTSAITDANLANVVSSVWNALAGRL